MSSDPAPWYSVYPTPSTPPPPSISRDRVLDLIKYSEGAEKRDYVLVDVRRNDHEGGTIATSVNLPAQSLYPTIPTLYTLFKAANITKVMWYCGSSTGRGTRCASWFADYLKSKGDSEMQSLILTGGIKGWATAGPEYTEAMLEYDSKVWEKYQ